MAAKPVDPARDEMMIRLWNDGLASALIAGRIGVQPHVITTRIAALRRAGRTDINVRSEIVWSNSWRDEWIDEARRLWLEGSTAGEVVAALRPLGARLSRSAVIGKMHRMGLKRDPSVFLSNCKRFPGNRPANPKGTRVPRAPSVPRIATAKGAASRHRLRTLKEAAEARPVLVCEELTPTTDIFGLKDGLCRFPIGDPKAESFGYCGREADGARVYCALHCDRAYTGVPVDVKALTKLAKWFDGGGRRKAA